jgi:HEAT repeat protein
MAVAVIPVLVVLITFLFWYSTWFGRPLEDGEMAQDLADTSVPHRTQHALAQVAAQIERGDAGARRWYPQVIRLGRDREPQVRLMAAWAMGQDNTSGDFHRALLILVTDPDPAVRSNAALALARFGDPSGEAQLRLLLRPYTLVAPQAGSLTFQLKEGDPVRSGSAVARIREGDAAAVEVRSPLSGQLERWVVKDGARVAAGDKIGVLSPGQEQVWEALRALYLVGRPEDLEAIELYARGSSGMPARIRQQAALTAEAIRKRASDQ